MFIKLKATCPSIKPITCLALPVLTHQLSNTKRSTSAYSRLVTASKCGVQFALCLGLKAKKWRKLKEHSVENHNTNCSIGRMTDLHSGGRWVWVQVVHSFFFWKSHLFAYMSLKFSSDITATWHSWTHQNGKLTTQIFWLLINICFCLFFTVLWRHWCGETTGNSCGTFLSKPHRQTVVN